MTIQVQVSVHSQVFIPRDYQIFAGLDLDHRLFFRHGNSFRFFLENQLYPLSHNSRGRRTRTIDSKSHRHPPPARGEFCSPP
jgi:hypothetical protein